MAGEDVALFVDWDNLQIPPSPGRAEALKSLAKPYGRLVLARAYCDWSARPGGAGEQYELYCAGIEPVYVPCRKPDGTVMKNGVDVKMSADCLDFSHLYGTVGTFVLVSCDVDFLHVAQSLRRRGLQVVVAGRLGGTSARIAAAGDAFVYYDEKPSEKPPCNYKVATVDKAIRTILKELQAEGNGCYPQAIGGLKQMLVARLPYFDEKAFGAGGFGEFVKAREKAGILRLVRKGTADFAALNEPI